MPKIAGQRLSSAEKVNGIAPETVGLSPTSGDVLTVSRFAHIDHVEVEFGDLTVLVGPQASGKSLVLQMLKLVVDGRIIAKTMEKFGLVFKDDTQLLARYFGAGMEKAWTTQTQVSWGSKNVTLPSIAKHSKRNKSSVYYVPAHRTLTLVDGYPPTFQQFRPETPFVVRQFSEELRQVLIEGMGQEVLFPQAKRLKSKVRDKINDAVFHGAELREDASGIQRQLKLHYHANETSLSYMTWTAGQREFIPLLLGLYYLLPAGRYSKRIGTDWVIVEEPEMGLHPMAIMSIMLLVLDLLSRGYRVILSTHSPLVLDIVWALNVLKRHRAKWTPVLKMFGIDGVSKANARGEVEMAEAALKKVYRVHLFKIGDDSLVTSRDVSSLDPASHDPDIAGWGGLTGMSGQIGKVVSRVVAAPKSAGARR